MATSDADARAFRVARPARERFGLDDPAAAPAPGFAAAPAVVPGGLLRASDRPAIRRLAARMNARRAPGEQPALAGEIAALVVLHEAGHLLIDHYQASVTPPPLRNALRGLRAALGPDLDLLLARFAHLFPSGSRAARAESRSSLLAELLLTSVANENPAGDHLRDLFDDTVLLRETRYGEAIEALGASIGAGPGRGLGADGLLAVLREPAAQAPTSLAGQLRYIRDRWGSVLGELGGRLALELDLALGELEEDERAVHRRFGAGAPGTPEASVETPLLASLDADVEQFSADSAWMPGVVLLAKSTLVWLDQLSRRHGREIRTLDAIPDEELDTLARWGVTGIWLIGLWERSTASATIKRRRGNVDAVASAYALDDYEIAAELGGEAALSNLRARAGARGIRLASDMVPNHMGIDSRWVVEHPGWFLSLPEPPYPSYAFSGPDLSPDPLARIVLEDHYWDGTDAAVVFLHQDTTTDEMRFIYHGNDGTSLPWNDTAQLDFLQAGVRERVIQAIIDVARRFPIIRFDAAMVLARKHVARLWWPAPGAGGGVPSRAAHALAPADFDRLMPAEFWREVVDRVAAEVPDTLLLAEAFWLLEGYFVRTLGMHRVYNSAFMHMFRDEDNAGYRRVIRETLEFDPEILERYVNFMSNPDEATAVEQFGTGDKYFGVATVLATLPGLPMVGHGQVEGFGEKYGMEFRRAMLDEAPNRGLVARHEREIFPLLRERGRFATAAAFRLFDLVTDDGSVAEAVLAYSNGRGAGRSLVVFHNQFATVTGHLRETARFAVKAGDGSKSLRRETLAEALGLAADDHAFLAFRDRTTGLEHLRRVGALRAEGLRLSLDAYACHVYDEFRDLPAGPGWAALAERLGEAGVPSLDDALADLDLATLHDLVAALFTGGHLHWWAAELAPPALVATVPAVPAGLGDAAGAPGAPGVEPAGAAEGAAGTNAGRAAAIEAAGADSAGAIEAAGSLAAEGPRAVGIAEPGAREAALDAVAAMDTELRAEGARRGIPDTRRATDPRTPRDRLAGGPTAARRLAAVSPLLADDVVRLETVLVLALGAGSLDVSQGEAARARFDACRLDRPLARGLRDAGLDRDAITGLLLRLRALLALPRPGDPPAAGPYAAVLLRDPAARVAVGVNTWDDVEWVTGDAWDAFADSAAAVLAVHAPPLTSPAGLAAIAGLSTGLREAARAAGYRVERLAAGPANPSPGAR